MGLPLHLRCAAPRSVFVLDLDLGITVENDHLLVILSIRIGRGGGRRVGFEWGCIWPRIEAFGLMLTKPGLAVLVIPPHRRTLCMSERQNQ